MQVNDRKFRVVLCIPLAIALFLSIERLCHLATDGFMITRITHALQEPSHDLHDVSANLSLILSQPFTYLASGAQSYVFVSQDNRYVIKFFKFHHLRIPPWIASLPLPHFLNTYRQAKIAKKNRALAKTLDSHKIAATLLPKETALVYLHLYPTHYLHQSLHLIDKLGIHYELDADTLSFVIQKKGTSFYGVLEQYINTNHMCHAKKAISDILYLSLERCKKGVGDLDPDFGTNFGAVEGSIVQLDIGRFYLEEQEKNPEVYKRELYRITRSFRQWLTEHSAELVTYLDDELAHIQGDSVF